MGIDFIPFAVFVVITTFTPGPGNIASAAMGMNYGYKRTFQFLSGMVVGYFLIMALCATLSSTLLRILPSVEPVLRVCGASYILWLAWGVARTNDGFAPNESSPMVFKHGFLLQALNPKAAIFGLTIYTTFLSSINTAPFLLSVTTLGLTAVTFCSVSLWAFGGARIRRYLHMTPIKKGLNFVLVALLLYCAAALSGIFTTSSTG
jgi:cysteine/O-acetylserine efflux protein